MIFHLSGPSSVYESYEDPITTKERLNQYLTTSQSLV